MRTLCLDQPFIVNKALVEKFYDDRAVTLNTLQPISLLYPTMLVSSS